MIASIALSGVGAIATTTGWLPPGAFVVGVALVLTGLFAVIGWGSADPALQLFGRSVVRANTTRSEVALTFDDGPDPTSTPQLLDTLAAARAQATFFLLVDHAESHPDLTAAIAADHQVGLHGLSHHPWLTLRSVRSGTAELLDAKRRLEHLVGRPVTTFRPPFGAVSPRLMASAAAAGLDVVWCSVRTRDGGSLASEEVVKRCERAAAGDIVLLHEGRPNTTAAIEEVLRSLDARGLRAVTVEALCASS